MVALHRSTKREFGDVPLMTLMARPAIITLFLINRHFFLSPCIWHISKKFIFPHWKTKHLAVGNFRDK